MTLDEAIEHAAQIADSYKDTVPDCKCAKEHRQLADWLTELKMLRTENAKLQDLVRGMRICSDDSEEAQKCPLYDENEPYRCRKDRLMSELGLSKE